MKFDAAESLMSRRRLLAAGLSTAAAAVARAADDAPASRPESRPAPEGAPRPVKAFCIDFNWLEHRPAPPATFAHADPAEHVRWYRDLGANVIQTFCVTLNGYAWYPSSVAPVAPGLRDPDFLGTMVEMGHKAGMKVMGYFCLGSNTFWEAGHPESVHGEYAGNCRIPFTLEYLDYFCRCVEESLERTGIDGIMIDWIRPPSHVRWLDCEKEMYRQLLGEAFPASGDVPPEHVRAFDRLAMERAWRHIRRTARAVRPAILWPTPPFFPAEFPIWEGHRMLREADWLLNEAPNFDTLDWLRGQIGARTLIVQNLCGWPDHDAGAWRRLDPRSTGFYGYAQADAKTTLPDESIEANARNIGILREAYHIL